MVSKSEEIRKLKEKNLNKSKCIISEMEKYRDETERVRDIIRKNTGDIRGFGSSV